MISQFSRTELLIGDQALALLKKSRVAVFGVGGVGGYVVEALARSGVGQIDLIDNDEVCLTNINRQIIATHETIGRKKVDVMEERILSINPDCLVHKHPCFYLPSVPNDIDFSSFGYVVDAIDTVSAKLDIVQKCKELSIPVMSCMGCGNRIEPTLLKVGDIFETSYDPLSKVMRRELRKRGIQSLKVLYSTECVLRPLVGEADFRNGEKTIRTKEVPGSTAFVPPVAGLIIASEVIKDLIRFDRNNRHPLSNALEKYKEMKEEKK